MVGKTSRNAGLSAKEKMERIMNETVDRLFKEIRSKYIYIYIYILGVVILREFLKIGCVQGVCGGFK